jgi:hypothetical protein
MSINEVLDKVLAAVKKRGIEGSGQKLSAAGTSMSVSGEPARNLPVDEI